MRRATPRPKAAPRPTYRLIAETSEQGRALYERLAGLVDAHHEDLERARIALAWKTTWKADADGRVILGKCKKASQLDRELAPYDFVILLNQEFWEDPRVSERQRDALLDHELMHAALRYDKDGEPKQDALGRQLYRIRKHDIEEFGDIVARYGCYKRDLEAFAVALRRGPQAELALEPPAADAPAAGARE